MAENADLDPGAGGLDNSDNQGGGYTITDVNEVLGDLKDDPVFKPHLGKNPQEFVGDLVKGYANAQKMIGGEKVVLPIGKLDTEENWNTVFDKLGRPKDPDGYALERPTLPEGLAYDENLEKGFKQVCHANGILPKQANALYKLWNDLQSHAFTTTAADKEKQATEAMESLRAELKTQDNFDGFLKLANEVLQSYGGDNVSQIVEKYQHDPDLIRLLGNIGKVMSEDSLKLGEKRFDLSGDDVKGKLNDILYNKENVLNNAYWSKTHPKHNEAIEEVLKLQTMIHGDTPVSMT